MIFCGVDPGVTGAIALLQSGELLECADLPTEPTGTSGQVKRWLDANALDMLLAEWSARHEFEKESVHGVIERAIPMPQMPSTTNASTFDSFGVCRGALSGWLDEVVYIEPRIWKKTFGLAKDKAQSIRTALALYPDAEKFLKLQKSHNRAEAILLAHWLLKEKL